MDVVQQDETDQSAGQSHVPDLRLTPQQLQTTEQDNDTNCSIKEEVPDSQDSEVTSENLSEIPPNLMMKMSTWKNIYGACVRKQSRDVTIYLLGSDVWHSFCSVGNEMIITKKGRRMFPVPTFVICDLDPEKLYDLSLEVNSVDNCVYKYVSGKWTRSKEGSFLYPTPFPGRSAGLHPSSPNTGFHWMKEPVSFATVKISNNLESLGTIVLQSMRKYVMALIIGELKAAEIKIRLPETVFIAVTQYQNHDVTQMKIEHNPFANAFRSSPSKSKDKDKSKRQPVDVGSEDESKAQEVTSSNQTPTLSAQLNQDLLWSLSRPDAWPTNPGPLPAYFEQQRHMFQNLLPFHSGRLNLNSSTQNMSIDHSSASWSRVLPPFGVGQSLYTPPELSELSLTSRFMLPLQGVNPLAHVRQIGELNRCSSSDVPLSLVKKIKPDSNMASSNSKSDHFRQSPKLKRNVPRELQNDESISHLQMQLPVGLVLNETNPGLASSRSSYSQFVPDFGFVPQGSSDGLPRSNSVGSREDISNHPREAANPKHAKRADTHCHDYSTPSSSQSWMCVETELASTEKQEASTRAMIPRPYNPPRFLSNSLAVEKPGVALRNADLWATTHEVVICTGGRPMFPFVSLSVAGLHPDRLYNFSLKLTPLSNFVLEYIQHEWVPSAQAFDELKNAVYPHPDNPQSGSQWGSVIVFDKLRLSRLRKGKNLLKLELRCQYLPQVIVETDAQLWEYPLRDATFITVKIDRSPCEVADPTVHYETPSPEPMM